MAKSIFIFNDGTGQHLNSDAISNVAKLFNFLPGVAGARSLGCDEYKVDATLEYHALYYRGIGTRDLRAKSETKEKQSFWHKILTTLKIKAELAGELVTGSSIKERVEAVLDDLKELWGNGDRIFLIGFSRGASSARISASYIKQIHPGIEIEYMLVFDTVYSVIGPVKIKDFPVIEHFTDKVIGPHVKRCDHLISGDEMRSSFPLTPVETRANVRQILFSGSHSDVGGGASHSSLSDFALQFCLEELKQIGVQFAPDALVNLKPDCAADIGWDIFNGTGQSHFPRDFKKISLQIHSSVLKRCAGGASAPTALAQLATFKTTSKSDLISLNELQSSFDRN